MSAGAYAVPGARTAFQARRLMLEALADGERRALKHGGEHAFTADMLPVLAQRRAALMVQAENDRLAALNEARPELLKAAKRTQPHGRDAWRFRFAGRAYLAASSTSRLLVRDAESGAFIVEGELDANGVPVMRTSRPMQDADGQPYP
ncbi:MAG: hypothetical protein J0L58_18590 [Burkholderiales bacterium]|nr:hypothetical protein [Burkholderiales bacterium]